MDELIVLGILVAAGLLIWLQICVAKEFQRIAVMKGHTEKSYFWWTLFLGMVGMMMVVALPSNRTEAQQEKAADEELPEI
jgi:hypothetical protein